MTPLSFLHLAENKPLATSLCAVAKVMAPAQRPWWIIGSAAVALHLDRSIDVADVDVLLFPDDARLVRQQLGISSPTAEAHHLFRSEEYFTWTGNGLPVEFMAGLSVFTGNEWTKIAMRTRQAFATGTASIYTPDVDELAGLLKLFGRPKDKERLALLEKAGFSV